MRRNLGAEDRLFRLVLAFSILPLGFVLSGHASLLALVGLEPLLVALVAWSPFYALLGVHTRATTAPLPTTIREVASAA